MTPRQITAYAKACRKQGIDYLKIDGLELSLKNDFQPSKSSLPSEAKEAEDVPAYSDESLLLWSTQGNFPEPTDN